MTLILVVSIKMSHQLFISQHISQSCLIFLSNIGATHISLPVTVPIYINQLQCVHWQVGKLRHFINNIMFFCYFFTDLVQSLLKQKYTLCISTFCVVSKFYQQFSITKSFAVRVSIHLSVHQIVYCNELQVESANFQSRHKIYNYFLLP